MASQVTVQKTPLANHILHQGMWKILGIMTLCLGLLGGCVSSEKYEGEKAKALNFQRLLAQEEKRTGEINVKYQEVQREKAKLESQNRNVSTELEALRDQLTRTEEELSRIREGTTSASGLETEDLTLEEPSIAEFGLDDIGFADSDFTDTDTPVTKEPEPVISFGEPTHYRVSKGETLYSISRQYGVSVQDLKTWNNLENNIIAVGQKLIVSQP